MRTITIPHTELSVSALCLGTSDMGSSIDLPTSFQLLDYFCEQGGTFVDTALVYGDWVPGTRSLSEKTVGAWLRQRGGSAGLTIATKGAHPNLATMGVPRLARGDIEADVETSLSNLGVEAIDLYWLHRDDPARPVDDILATLNDLQRAGKIRYFGCSNWKTPRIMAAQEHAARHGISGMAANQLLWNAGVPDPRAIADSTVAMMDDQMFSYHLATGLAAVAFSSQANGLFSRMQRGTLDAMNQGIRSMYRPPENERRFERMVQLASRTGLGLSAIVLGYLLGQPFATIPIIGCRSLAQLEDSLQAGDLRLSAEQIRYIEQG